MLDVKLQNNTDLTAALSSPTKEEEIILVSPEMLSKIQFSHSQLREVISKYEHIVTQLEDMWQEKVCMKNNMKIGVSTYSSNITINVEKVVECNN